MANTIQDTSTVLLWERRQFGAEWMKAGEYWYQWRAVLREILRKTDLYSCPRQETDQSLLLDQCYSWLLFSLNLLEPAVFIKFHEAIQWNDVKGCSQGLYAVVCKLQVKVGISLSVIHWPVFFSKAAFIGLYWYQYLVHKFCWLFVGNLNSGHILFWPIHHRKERESTETFRFQ